MSNANGAAVEQQRAVEYVEIELDRPRRLLLNHNAAALAERELRRITGDWLPLAGIMARIKLAAMSELIVLLWAMLSHEDPKLTQEAVGNALDGKPLDYVIEKIEESFNKHFPPMEKQEAQEDSHGDPPQKESREPTG